MRKVALIIAIIGLGFLVGFLLVKPKHIENLNGLAIGETVSLSGTVEEERKFGNGKLLIINEMPIFCECSAKYAGVNVYVEGIIEKFPETLRVRAFKIMIID